jgi:hypothetical protein
MPHESRLCIRAAFTRKSIPRYSATDLTEALSFFLLVCLSFSQEAQKRGYRSKGLCGSWYSNTGLLVVTAQGPPYTVYSPQTCIQTVLAFRSFELISSSLLQPLKRNLTVGARMILDRFVSNGVVNRPQMRKASAHEELSPHSEAPR